MRETGTMTTRERIVDEALTLFAAKGFKGTTVRNIADAVGIRDASLYKHFSSKQQILDTIVEQMYEHMDGLTEQLGIPSGSSTIEDAVKFYEHIDRETIVSLGKKVFAFYLTDGFVSRFWRLASMEQYSNPEFYEIYRRLFTDEGIEYQTQLFAGMIEAGAFRKSDPQLMAFHFYSPIFLLLHRYAGRPEMLTEAEPLIERLVGDFYDRYHG